MSLFLTVASAGLTSGIVYGLFGLGMGLTLRASGTLNLAHGDLLMLAVYVAVATTGGTGLVPVAVTVLVATLGSLIAYLAVYAAVASARSVTFIGVGFLPALAVAMLARAVAEWLVPAGSLPVDTLLPGPQATLPGGTTLPGATWWLFGAAIALPAALWLLLHRTGLGSKIRAIAEDPVLAQVTGIPLRATVAVAYTAAGVLAGLAGVLYAALFGQVFTGLGWQATIKGFAAIVLGGLGSVRGALLGGLTLGVVEAATAAFVSSTYRDVVTYLLLIAVLVAAPRGLAAYRDVRAL